MLIRIFTHSNTVGNDRKMANVGHRIRKINRSNNFFDDASFFNGAFMIYNESRASKFVSFLEHPT